MINEITKYDNEKDATVSRTVKFVGAEQNPEDNSKTVFPEDV
jgi:hypothetical protein